VETAHLSIAVNISARQLRQPEFVEKVLAVLERTGAKRTHEEKLDLLAEVAVRVGLGLRAGQELLMTASLDALPLARRITEQAYRAGASLVTTLYSDDEAALMRYRFAPGREL
jgi:hypothetical protein